MIAPVKEARKFLEKQWPPQPPIRMSKEEYLAMLSKAWKNVKQPDDIDIEEIQRRIDAQYALIEEMQRWLDKYLKN
jgi:20S proteasome alpha/beta subunit